MFPFTSRISVWSLRFCRRRLARAKLHICRLLIGCRGGLMLCCHAWKISLSYGPIPSREGLRKTRNCWHNHCFLSHLTQWIRFMDVWIRRVDSASPIPDCTNCPIPEDCINIAIPTHGTSFIQEEKLPIGQNITCGTASRFFHFNPYGIPGGCKNWMAHKWYLYLQPVCKLWTFRATIDQPCHRGRFRISQVPLLKTQHTTPNLKNMKILKVVNWWPLGANFKGSEIFRRNFLGSEKKIPENLKFENIWNSAKYLKFENI